MGMIICCQYFLILFLDVFIVFILLNLCFRDSLLSRFCPFVDYIRYPSNTLGQFSSFFLLLLLKNVPLISHCVDFTDEVTHSSESCF